jgi:hypoxanthine phosphoribosyltransferase
MGDIQPELVPLLGEEEIRSAVSRLAEEIQRDYRDKNPLLIGILKGSFIFLADLIRNLDIPLEVDFIRLASYGTGTSTSGKVTLVHDIPISIADRHVLVVEDIVDTGLTTCYLLDYLRNKAPASLKLCALIDKPSRRQVPVRIDYLGFSIPDRFIVGYGIDWREHYRNLPDIRYVKES